MKVNNYLLFIAALLMLCAFSALSAQEQTVPQQAAQPTEPAKVEQEKAPQDTDLKKKVMEQDEKIKKLEEEMQQIKKGGSADGKQDDRMDEIETRVDGVERSTLIDRVKLRMDVKMTMNNYIYRDKSDTDRVSMGLITKSGETLMQWNMRGRLKLNSMLGDSVQLNAWLSMYKQFLESNTLRYDNDYSVPNYDLSRGYYPGNSSVYMERLSLDWFIVNWLTFSIGRSSSTSGIPSDLRDNSPILGTFPESLVNCPVDAMYLTFNGKPLLDLEDSYLRLFYIPGNVLQMSLGDNNLFEERYMQSLFGGQIDFTIPKLGGSRIIATFVANPAIKLSEMTVKINGVDTPLEMPASGGGMYLSNILGYFPRAFGGPVDLFLSGSLTYVTSPTRSAEHPNNGFVGYKPDPNSSYVVPLQSIYGNDLTGDDFLGYSVYAGFRYNLPVQIFEDAMKFGWEVSYNSKYFYGYFAPDTTGLSKLSLRGLGSEVYLTVPIQRWANVRVGYIMQNHQYPWAIMMPVGGGIPKINEYVHDIYLILNAYF